MKLYPFFDEVLVRLVEMESVTPSGILVSVSISNPYEVGVVVRVGSDVNPEISVGDRVLFTRGSGLSVGREGDDEYALVKDEHIRACVLDESSDY